MTTTEMTREQQEEYQKQLVEEKGERDAEFLVKKAERAALRSCLRDKYRLPKSERDDSILEQAGDEVDVPEELLSMVEGEGGEEEQSASLLGHMSTLQNMDMEQMKEKASATVTGLRSKAEDKCHVM
ncbi:complexin-4b [Gadus macrocephalus]|uniref:complexin-4b n=1 Tax=Gadus macrocephalus TaxID=80720 RepID=UPI0028CB62BB|nr:complexin-4b [Gadus macrocephalus]